MSGCGDYSILKQVQTVIPELGLPREQIVLFQTLDTRHVFHLLYGDLWHTLYSWKSNCCLSGLKAARKDLSVWIVTGDGDSMSISGNHFIHLFAQKF